jgi:hypothetical protein
MLRRFLTALEVVPVKGRLRNMRVRTQNPPGAGQSYVITLNYGVPAPTTVTCTISGAVSQVCTDLTHDQQILVGGFWNVSVVTSAGATATGVITIGFENNLE